MSTPGHEFGTYDEEALRAAVEKATGQPLEPVQYVYLTGEQRRRHEQGEFRRFYENPPDEPLGFCSGCGHHPTSCTCRGVCPDCCADDHCQMCDCCCEPETP